MRFIRPEAAVDRTIMKARSVRNVILEQFLLVAKKLK
jgi:hypothetical protein